LINIYKILHPKSVFKERKKMGSSLTLVSRNLSSKVVLQELKLSFKLLLESGAILKEPRFSRAAD